MKQNTHLFAHVAISPGRGASSSTPTGRVPQTTRSVCGAPARSTPRASRSSAAWNWKSIASRTAWPLTVRIRSPAWSPAAAAGVRARTPATTTPSAEERGFIGFPLGDGRGIEEAHALHDVLQARHDREARRQPHEDDRAQLDAEEAPGQPRQDGEDLEEGRCLAGPRRARVDPAAGHVDGEGALHQDDVAVD